MMFINPIEYMYALKLLLLLFIISFSGCFLFQKNLPEDGADLTESRLMVGQLDGNTWFNQRYPSWLIALYPSEFTSNYEFITQELTAYAIINDSLTFCTYKQVDPTGETHYLVSYVNMMRIDSVEIAYRGDHDTSIPFYSWKKYSIKLADTLFTTEFIATAHDSLVNEEGMLKDGCSLWDEGTSIDTLKQVFHLTSNGTILKIDKPEAETRNPER